MKDDSTIVASEANVAATLREIAMNSIRNSGLIGKVIKKAKKAAENGAFYCTINVTQRDYSARSKLDPELVNMGFKTNWDRDVDSFWYDYELTVYF